MKATCPGTSIRQKVKEHHFTSDDIESTEQLDASWCNVLKVSQGRWK